MSPTRVKVPLFRKGNRLVCSNNGGVLHFYPSRVIKTPHFTDRNFKSL